MDREGRSFIDLLFSVNSKTRLRNAVHVGIHAGLLVGGLGAFLWATGRPFVFPSLGPTAFVLAVRPREHRARTVVGGHLCGVVGGLLAYAFAGEGLVLTDLPSAQSVEALRLAGSGLLSVGLTAAGMVVTRTVHAPACATTLIVSLGVLPTLLDGGIIMISVGIMYSLHTGWRVLDPLPGRAP